ncbi:hypothetical protein O1Q96_40740 [Streptomyces sp. Qhu-G9]|uniref:hypothetical protein n=1 Tax=Streptomyces sp. Qhu-G9 TaxID=3452799 RepID=UPI0022AC38DB|nr:hypothetical protein [Streptomyces aurantiacus]WAU85480.1 hypothetical protein O1Q96_40740 [Streptomyces aurantiacus]
MSIGSRRLAELIRELVSADERVRESGSDRVADWTRSYSAREGHVIAEVLAVMASFEESRVCLEAQLHALSELDTEDKIGNADLAPLRDIDGAVIGAERREYLEYLELRL